MHDLRIMTFSAVAPIALLAAGLLMPDWVNFLLIIALSKGLVSLGLVILLRSGLLSFGQGLFYCVGGYGAGLLMLWGGVNDAVLLVCGGGVFALIVGIIIGSLVAGYRKIFFATLTLALSMLVYGALTKADILGGSDGLNLHAPTFFGWRAGSANTSVYALYAFVVVLVVLLAGLCRAHFRSVRGLVSLSVRDNEIRVEYLGASVRRVVVENFSIAAFLGGVGGAINALALGHIDPELAFWTTSGEFVFVAILAGQVSVVAVFAASVLLEVARSWSSEYFPNVWQMTLGVFMLAVIFFLPDGLGALLQRYGPLTAVEDDSK
jgi:ABC-type branched-subunit amino acid transport system permease subunit